MRTIRSKNHRFRKWLKAGVVIHVFVGAAVMPINSFFGQSNTAYAQTNETALIANIQYSLDQGDTWINLPTTPGSYITVTQNMTFGLRAIKDDDMLEWPSLKPIWQKQDDDDVMYGDTVWVLFEETSSGTGDLKTVTVTCDNSYQISTLVVAP